MIACLGVLIREKIFCRSRGMKQNQDTFSNILDDKDFMLFLKAKGVGKNLLSIAVKFTPHFSFMKDYISLSIKNPSYVT